MRRAKFSIWRVERRHEAAGVIVADLLRDGEAWLVDEGPRVSARPGLTFAGRLCWPADFAMTRGVVVPIDAALVEEVLLASATWPRSADPAQVADDPRFATAIYRGAVETGLMDGIEFREFGTAA
jgi:hypothetical protein